MAPTNPTTTEKTAKPAKLPRLPQTQKIQKRPLLHPAIISPRSSSLSPKIVFVSPSSPFISTVKRVRKYLDNLETRAGPSKLSSNDRELMRDIESGIDKVRGGKKSGQGQGEVLIKGTGRAIAKVMALAAWWQEQEGVQVRVRTGGVGAVDDVVGVDGEGEEAGVGESRVRRVSVLEVGVSYV
ncbi:ribonuclease p mrp subunit pop7 protein [Rutstroemia sp. NJR-2017a BBW]|nr:ribonuclease p mrp subunit pop7 protein [Rutstroemia sp. NJR-2017a BBW]